jgi:Family of unknown function (DUF5654)
MEIKPTYLGTMIGLATVAFGLIAAGAWNTFIKDLIGLFLKSGNGIWAEFIYAIFVTILAIVVVQGLAKLAEKEAEIRSRLPFGNKPQG